MPNHGKKEAAVAAAESDVADAQSALDSEKEGLEHAIENRQAMEQRVERTQQALMAAENTLEQVRQECAFRLTAVEQSIQSANVRLVHAQEALNAYLAANPAAKQFYDWLHWQPQAGKPVTPDVIVGRMNLSPEQQRLFHEYLCERNPQYRALCDKYRSDFANAKGDVERFNVVRNIRIHLSGAYAEHLARQALAPLGGKVETQGQTYFEDGRYTKTDLLITGLKVPVILGRGKNMSAPVGGSLACEIKCGKAEYLYAQSEHMTFQAGGHKNADTHCTLCSRDILELSPEREQKLRNDMREAGSPMIGMLPTKDEIDRVVLDDITGQEEQA